MRSQLIRLLFLLSVFLVFCTSLYSQNEPAGSEAKTLEIKNVRLVAWQVVDEKRKLVEVERLLEIAPRQLMPSNKFDVECEIIGGKDDHFGDYFVWTTVDFLVAPVTRAYEQMGNGALSSSVGWGQMAEMRDLKATPVNLLRPGESRKVAVRGLDLSPVLAAFPIGEDGELWPWLVRVTVHVQDRSGKQLTSAERTVRLAPNSARKKNHYNDPLPRSLGPGKRDNRRS
jgi:hypothetical protein